MSLWWQLERLFYLGLKYILYLFENNCDESSYSLYSQVMQYGRLKICILMRRPLDLLLLLHFAIECYFTKVKFVITNNMGIFQKLKYYFLNYLYYCNMPFTLTKSKMWWSCQLSVCHKLAYWPVVENYL